MTPGGQASPRSSDQKIKFLGLAFAGADLAFEVDRVGLVTFVLGAVEQMTGVGEAQFVGMSWTRLVVEEDAGLLVSLLDNLKPGERQGPLRVGLKPKRPGGLKRFASLSVFRLPQNGEGLSCALSLGAPPVQPEIKMNAHGLIDRDGFDEAATKMIADAAQAGHQVALSLVELSGLEGAMKGLAAAEAEAARKRINATLRLESYGGMGASEIAPERFALVRSQQASASRVVERIQQVCGEGVTPVSADLKFEGATPGQSLKAVRYALDRYIEYGPGEIASDFGAMLEKTAGETARFRSTLAAGAFEMAYQPVIDLDSNLPHHFEALARFPGADSPEATIHLAEEVGMIADFDLAVAKVVVDLLAKQDKGPKIAINLSAISLMTPRCMEAFARITASNPRLRPRLLIEITETQKLGDLAKANAVIAELRRLGHPVCLDDFGSGAASLDYLSHLEVDFIKIDGRYIKALDTRPRDIMVIKYVAALCKELGVGMIAEMVETKEAAAVVQGLGIGFGQGWHYGKPTPMPVWGEAPSGPPIVARRMGVVEQWR